MELASVASAHPLSVAATSTPPPLLRHSLGFSWCIASTRARHTHSSAQPASRRPSSPIPCIEHLACGHPTTTLPPNKYPSPLSSRLFVHSRPLPLHFHLQESGGALCSSPVRARARRSAVVGEGGVTPRASLPLLLAFGDAESIPLTHALLAFPVGTPENHRDHRRRGSSPWS